jgi:hypothetical protein
MAVLLNLCSLGIGLYIAIQYMPLDRCNSCDLQENYDATESTSANTIDSDSDSDADSELYVQQDRQVEEKGGKLVVTITYVPVLETEEEVREMVEKSPLEESPTEETTEFEELLKYQ